MSWIFAHLAKSRDMYSYKQMSRQIEDASILARACACIKSRDIRAKPSMLALQCARIDIFSANDKIFIGIEKRYEKRCV